MKSPDRTVHVSLASALALGAPPPGNLAVPLFAHGSLEAELYCPHDRDLQQPHSRDEVYVVARGEAQPLVPTADGVREPQNRRVEIVLQ